MATIEWLKQEFHYGYDSGDPLALVPDAVRAKEEALIGGSYREVFLQAVLPYIHDRAKVLELGPGRGSWTRALLGYLPSGEVHALDYQDLAAFLKPELYEGRLTFHRVADNGFAEVEDRAFDFFWSFGVLCHNDQGQIRAILANALPKMKPGGYSAHLISDWVKLDAYGWQRGGIPPAFRDMPDAEMWWPRNSAAEMAEVAEACGWEVVSPDLGLVERDSVVLLRRPES